MWYFVLFYYVLSIPGRHAQKFLIHGNEDVLDFKTTMEKLDYPLEIYNLKTEDDYILRIFRIPHGKHRFDHMKFPTQSNNQTKKVVFLMHGLFGSGYDFVSPGANHSLALMLADMDFDVWIGNARGNIFSRRHAYLDPDKDAKEFWNFSWNEIGLGDLPTMLKFIRKVTAASKISYVGLSQGTTSFFVYCSEKPTECQEHIDVMISIAPVAYLGHVRGIMKELSQHVEFFKWLSPTINVYELYSRNVTNLMRLIIHTVCKWPTIMRDICNALLLVMVDTGDRPREVHAASNKISVFVKYALTGSSVKQILHYAQLIKSGNFEKYDYGMALNKKIYNSEKPPKYNLSKILVPVAIFHGDGDLYAQKPDLNKLECELPNLIHSYKIPFRGFNHFDYIAADGIGDILYKPIINLLLTGIY